MTLIYGETHVQCCCIRVHAQIADNVKEHDVYKATVWFEPDANGPNTEHVSSILPPLGGLDPLPGLLSQ